MHSNISHEVNFLRVSERDVGLIGHYWLSEKGFQKPPKPQKACYELTTINLKVSETMDFKLTTFELMKL